MIPEPETRTATARQHWSDVMTSLLGYPWKVWDMQCQIGMSIVDSMLRMTGGREMLSIELKTMERLSSLEEQALERLRKGLSPPREIYELPYRGRVNWSEFPIWARPTDPEVFEGCSHEG